MSIIKKLKIKDNRHFTSFRSLPLFFNFSKFIVIIGGVLK